MEERKYDFGQEEVLTEEEELIEAGIEQFIGMFDAQSKRQTISPERIRITGFS